MEGSGQDSADDDIATSAGDLFLRDKYGRERRCYVAAGSARPLSGELSNGSSSSAVRELSPEAVHSIDRISALLADDQTDVNTAQQWDADAVQDSYETKRLLMNSSSVRVVPGSEGSYGPVLTAADPYHFAFSSVTDGR